MRALRVRTHPPSNGGAAVPMYEVSDPQTPRTAAVSFQCTVPGCRFGCACPVNIPMQSGLPVLLDAEGELLATDIL